MALSTDMQARKDAILKKKPATFGVCAIHDDTIAMLKDTSENGWCQSCKQRYDLFNWGKAHEWQGVYVPPFAIAEGEWFWNSAIKVGRDEAIRAFHAGIIGGTDDVEVSA